MADQPSRRAPDHTGAVTDKDTKTLLEQLLGRFRDEQTAIGWFESVFWSGGRFCGRCGSRSTREVTNAKPAPYQCRNCRSYFTVRAGTLMDRSKTPYRKWAVALHLELFSKEHISQSKLRHAIGVSQKTAWLMLHRIREMTSVDSSGQVVRMFHRAPAPWTAPARTGGRDGTPSATMTGRI